MTKKNRSFRPSPAMIVACMALVLALTGSAIAAGVAKNSVRSAQIADGTVRTIDLRDSAVNSAKVADDSLTTTDLGANSVATSEIAENAVSSPEVAPDSLTAGDLGPASVASSEVADQSLTANDLGPESAGASEIATDAVGSIEISPGAVHASELATITTVSDTVTIKGGNNASVDTTCPAGSTLISGGARGGFYQVALSGSYRSSNGWHVDARSSAVGDTTLTAYANCLVG
jgi:hypothetical protein